MTSPAPTPQPVISMRGIVKRFRQVAANDHVTLDIRDGEIFALVGENGAGKSTLMNILSGYLTPDAGELAFHGEPVRWHSPADAIARGIGMVHQHFMLVGPFTALENIVLGAEPTARFGTLEMGRAHRVVESLMDAYHLTVPMDVPVAQLGVGEQQRVEILKALYRKARVLILDEPTAVLTPQEVDKLFEVLREIRGTGATIIFITHKLAEVLNLADRIGVMRAGRLVAVKDAAEVNPESLAELIVGARIESAIAECMPPGHDVLLELKNVSVTAAGQGRIPLDNISLSIRSGEILGIAGVLGNGQREMEGILTGALVPDSGEIFFRGQKFMAKDPADFLAAGISHIPDDRRRQGLIGEFSVSDNLILGRQGDSPFSAWGIINKNAVRTEAIQAITHYDVRPPQPGALARNLSGGNQQKAVVAREMRRDAALLIAAHPTRGVDIGATMQIHDNLMKLRARGGGVILISADLDELLTLSDRIGVLYKGRLVDVRPKAELNERILGAMMIGGKGDAVSGSEG